MSHSRKLIRDKIVTLLTGATSAGSKIFPCQSRPVGEDQLPCILVYTNSESVDIFQESPRQYERKTSISIEIQAAADETLEDTLDGIAEQIENKLMQDYTLGDTAADLILKETDVTMSSRGDTVIGSCRLTYLVLWYSLAVSDFTDANGFTDLDGMDVQYQRPETKDVASGQMDAEDTIDLSS
jgi:hypothetical protein